MATITIRDLDEPTRTRLSMRALGKGQSLEDEIREVLMAAVAVESSAPRPTTVGELLERIRGHFAEVGYADDLQTPPRGECIHHPESTSADQ